LYFYAIKKIIRSELGWPRKDHARGRKGVLKNTHKVLFPEGNNKRKHTQKVLFPIGNNKENHT